MSHHPYRLRSAHGAVHALPEALALTMQDPADGAAAPFAATAGALAALAGLPRREVPGVRVLDSGFFDVTSEAGEGELELGEILDGQDRPVGSFRVPLATLNRHAFVTGATGSGKSQTVRHLLEQLSNAGIPWLAIEAAKSEYAAIAGRVEPAQVTVINPSAPDGVPFSVNPLEPEPGYPVQAHIDMIRALFMAAFDAEEPFPQIMSLALQRVYEATGWDVVTGGAVPGSKVPPSVPTLEQLQRHAMDVIQEIGYGREVQADVEGFISLRLRSLRVGSAGRFFEGGHPADIGGLLRRNVVLAIEDVANDEDKAFLMGTLIIRVAEHLRMRARQEKSASLRHVIVIEEAHRLLRDRGTGRAATHAVELLARHARRDQGVRRGHRGGRADPHQAGLRRGQEHRAQGRAPAARRGRPAARRRGHEPQRGAVPPGRLAAARRRGRVRRRDGPAAAGARAARRVAREGAGRPAAADQGPPLGRLRRAVPHRPGLHAGGAPRGRRARRRARVGLAAHLVRHGRARLRQQPAAARRAAGARGRLGRAADPSRRVPARHAGRALGAAPRLGAAELVRPGAAHREGGRRRHPPAGRPGGGERPGASWVLPQVRWLHEVDRLFPYGRPAPDLRTPAPPMEYAIFRQNGDGPHPEPHGELLGHRAKALRHHPLSMEMDHNRELAWRVILGDDEHEGVRRDVDAVAIGVEPQARLRHVGQIMGGRVAGGGAGVAAQVRAAVRARQRTRDLVPGASPGGTGPVIASKRFGMSDPD
ncbi:ATP-binding protein [Nonomuraea ferruginea]